MVVIGAIIWAVFHFLFAPPEQETDDAYVAGDIVAITARDAGTVIAIHADNTQTVTAGAPCEEPESDVTPRMTNPGLFGLCSCTFSPGTKAESWSNCVTPISRSDLPVSAVMARVAR